MLSLSRLCAAIFFFLVWHVFALSVCRRLPRPTCCLLSLHCRCPSVPLEVGPASSQSQIEPLTWADAIHRQTLRWRPRICSLFLRCSLGAGDCAFGRVTGAMNDRWKQDFSNGWSHADRLYVVFHPICLPIAIYSFIPFRRPFSADAFLFVARFFCTFPLPHCAPQRAFLKQIWFHVPQFTGRTI